MPVRTFAIGVAIVCFVLACLLVIATISAIRLRRIVALVFRGVLALGLLAIVATQLPTIFGPTPGPKPFFKQPAPVSDDTIVNYSTSINGSPLVRAGGKGGGIYNVSLDNVTLEGVQARDGKVRWQRSLPLNTAFSYGVVDGTIYLSARGSGPSQLFALRATDGSILWQATFPQGFLSTPPVVSEGLVFLFTQAPASAASSFPSQLVALRASDGAQVWSAPVESIRNGSLLAQSGVVYYVLAEDGGQVMKSQARRTTDGKLLWSSDVIYKILAANADTLYAVVSRIPEISGNSLIALNKLNGAKRWEFMQSNSGFKTAAVDSSGLYLCDQDPDPTQGYTMGSPQIPGTIYALDPNTGALHWKTTPRPGGCGKLTIGLTAVYTQVFQAIVALRQTDGTIIWQSNPQDGWTLLATDATAGVLYATAILDVPSNTISLSLFPPQYAQVYLYAISEAGGSPYWGVPVGPVLRIYPHIVI